MATSLGQHLSKLRGDVMNCLRGFAISHRHLGQEQFLDQMRLFLGGLHQDLLNESIWPWKDGLGFDSLVIPDPVTDTEQIPDFSPYMLEPLLDDQRITDWLTSDIEEIQALQSNAAILDYPSPYSRIANEMLSTMETYTSHSSRHHAATSTAESIPDIGTEPDSSLAFIHASVCAETPPPEPPCLSDDELSQLDDTTGSGLTTLEVFQKLVKKSADMKNVPYFMLTKFIIGFASPRALASVENGIDLAKNAYTNLGPQIDGDAEKFAARLDSLDQVGNYGAGLRRYQLLFLNREHSQAKNGKSQVSSQSLEELTKRCYPRHDPDDLPTLRKTTSNRIQHSKIWHKLAEKSGHQFFLSLVPIGDLVCSDNKMEKLPEGILDLTVSILWKFRGEFLDSLAEKFHDVDNGSMPQDASTATAENIPFDSEQLVQGWRQCLRRFNAFHGIR